MQYSNALCDLLGQSLGLHLGRDVDALTVIKVMLETSGRLFPKADCTRNARFTLIVFPGLVT